MDADAIVIGAGAAGLAAARLLGAQSLRVIVLEARDREGGRVCSRQSARAAVPAELGAEFIHGRASETMSLLREAGTVEIDRIGGESWRCADGGVLQRDDDSQWGAGIFEETSALQADESVDTFLGRFAGEKTMQETADVARAFVEGFDAADPAIASAYAIADEWQSGVDFATARPLGGYPPIFKRLRDACEDAGVQISLSTAVARIVWHRGAVAVHVEDHSGAPRTIRARAAIITLPVGVLRHRGDETEVVFDPELPATKREALSYIEMGHAVKVVLGFRTAFWEALHGGRYRNAAFFRSAGQPFAAYWTQLPVRSELIVAWAGGPKAIALRDTSQSKLIDLALDGFGALFGESTLAREAFEEGFMHDWSHDPFARGAYSYISVGGRDARIALAAPVDETLFFAGEATSNDGQGGTVNGALATGERAAREAAAALGRMRDR
jgi:monoamine oxidase